MLDITQYFEKGYVAPDIIKFFEKDLREQSQNVIDIAHSNLLLRYSTYLASNDFLDSVSDDMTKFRNQIVDKYSDITLTICGRIKSIVRLEEKFNGYIIEFCSSYYHKYGSFPSEEDMSKYLQRFRDLIAYRIIISVPETCLKGRDKDKVEIDYLYKIANSLPLFFTRRGYSIENAPSVVGVSTTHKRSKLLQENRRYYKDYVVQPKENGYQSLHIALIDNHSHFANIEIQLRTFEMDCFAELDENVNHSAYESTQNDTRTKSRLPFGICSYYDEAVQRYSRLYNYDLTKAKIDHFKAVRLPNGTVIYNDHAGVKFARVIDPREYLASRVREN